MKGDKKVIEWLNKQLGNELTAISQYFLHARMYKNWGLKRIADHEYRESIGEMKHADILIERILLLEGAPSLLAPARLFIGTSVPDMLSNDLKVEQTSHVALKEAIAYCETCGDYVSRGIFADILEETEEHIDWIETQLDLIDKVGLQNYLQSQMDGGS